MMRLFAGLTSFALIAVVSTGPAAAQGNKSSTRVSGDSLAE